MAWYWLIAIVVVIVVYIIATYNGLIRLRNLSEEGFSTMDVYMKKRYDLIPNLVETVKAYAKHESETLENVVSARNKAVSAQGIEARQDAEQALNQGLGRLFAVMENYPDLKADRQFLDLQKQLQTVEQDIAQSRKYYNATVRDFNTKCEVFPSVLVAKMFAFEKKPLFEIADVERENVKVQF